MKILAQDYRTGELQMLELPEPSWKSGMLVVKTMASLVSIGMERYMLWCKLKRGQANFWWPA